MRAVALVIAVGVVLSACGSGEPVDKIVEQREREREQQRERERDMYKARELAKREAGLTITLPKAAVSDVDDPRPSLVVDIPASGDVYVGGRVVTDDELELALRAAYTRDKNVQVVFRADKGVAHGRIVGLMERAKTIGITRLAIGTVSAP